MTTEKQLGKIDRAWFGIGGYQNAMIGVFLSFSGKDWAIGDQRASWDYETLKPSAHANWTEEDRTRQYADIVRHISGILKKAKVNSLEELKGIPVEVEIEGGGLKSWRILEEVL